MNQPQFAHPHSLFRCNCRSSIIHHSAFVRRSLSTPPQCCLSVVLYPFLHTCRSSSIPPHLSFITHSSTFVIHHPFLHICHSSSVGLLPCLLFCHLFTAPHLSPNIHSFTLFCHPSSTPLHHCVNYQPLLHIILSPIINPSYYFVTHHPFFHIIWSPTIHFFTFVTHHPFLHTCHPSPTPSHLSPIIYSFRLFHHPSATPLHCHPQSTALHSASIIHAFTFVAHHPLLHIILLPTIHLFTFLCHPSSTASHVTHQPLLNILIGIQSTIHSSARLLC